MSASCMTFVALPSVFFKLFLKTGLRIASKCRIVNEGSERVRDRFGQSALHSDSNEEPIGTRGFIYKEEFVIYSDNIKGTNKV